MQIWEEGVWLALILFSGFKRKHDKTWFSLSFLVTFSCSSESPQQKCELEAGTCAGSWLDLTVLHPFHWVRLPKGKSAHSELEAKLCFAWKYHLSPFKRKAASFHCNIQLGCSFLFTSVNRALMRMVKGQSHPHTTRTAPSPSQGRGAPSVAESLGSPSLGRNRVALQAKQIQKVPLRKAEKIGGWQ